MSRTDTSKKQKLKTKSLTRDLRGVKGTKLKEYPTHEAIKLHPMAKYL